MLDFLNIATRSTKKGVIEIYPKFKIISTTDLMIRGGDFYAIWNEESQLWSTDEQTAIELIDRELSIFSKEYRERTGDDVRVLYLWDADSGMIDVWHKYCQKQMRDRFHMLDETILFSNSESKKTNYASKKLSYPLEECDISSYEKLISTLYSEEERRKIEWCIGAVVSGDSKKIQKFCVLYGAAGTGKSTILNIIQMLFDGYYSVFDAKALGSSSNVFALEAFKTNPLVAIQHDGDLSRIEDNTRLNSLVSHEMMTVNEKFKSTYTNRFKSFLFMGTNKPVKITDGKSGLIRRLIDVKPTGNKVGKDEYDILMSQIKFELGGIAKHCLDLYLSDVKMWDTYMPKDMMSATNEFYDFVLDSYLVFKREETIGLKQAWEMYKVYCDASKVPFPMSKKNFREELKNYFRECVTTETDTEYSIFKSELFLNNVKEYKVNADAISWLSLNSQQSIFDDYCKDEIAQYATEDEIPRSKWGNVKTTLKDLDTHKLHYVRLPENHIVVDFDICKNGKKSLEENIKAASKFPKTYAETSKSGNGLHLHYIYDGDVEKLSRIYDENIEVKVFTGNSSLRRKLVKCNDIPIATINSGLPLKEEVKKTVSENVIKSEKALRVLIKRNLLKEIHPATKPSVDFIFKILEDAYNSGLHYDVTDMRSYILSFAASSTNNADYCIVLVSKMKFKSEEPSIPISDKDKELVFYDVEVFPNLFLVNFKFAGKGKTIIRMINPAPKEIEDLMRFNLVGFNCRRYDNHMLYARRLGYSNQELFELSQKIINNSPNCFFGEAYNISYTDVYDYSSKKQSLKKWEIELGIHHKELGLPWDQPVPEDKWIMVAEYCDIDVLATEAVFDATKADFTAREILADLAGMTVNDTTNSLTTKIIFGNDKHPELVYTDLSEEFPGYEFKQLDDNKFHNMYRGTDLGFGGYVYAEPGMYKNIALLDVASMHPNSAINLNIFGKYTQRFKELLDIRIHVKHKEFDIVKTMFDGRLAKYMDDPDMAKSLAQALKIAINSVYGLTSAKFDNPFRDIRNKNNIVALRGALFMRTLQDEVQSRGFTVAHIKTDSIKIPDATPEIIDFVMDFGKKYGYTFEHEATYEKMCLVNDAVYIAKYKDGDWTATGTQFQVPYVFKTLFSKEPIEFEDLCETKSVTSALYLDMNEQLPEGEHDYHFIGKVGLFCPIKEGCGGGVLLRKADDKYHAATGTKGYRWLESEMVRQLNKENDIDIGYYDSLVTEAIGTISAYGFYDWFVDEPDRKGE
jgi:hypothetical protein